ncbi:MAG: spore coat associated protein CotJA [Hungatella sp.]|nr:spore coat associated protein CotJA [Hungatella sp.]
MCHLNQSRPNTGCSCHSQKAGPAAASASSNQALASLPLAIATVPIQAWEPPYESCKALTCGTVFPSLNLPFYAKGGGCCG